MSASLPSISIVRSAPKSAEAVGLATGTSGPVPRQLGLTRSSMAALGFSGKVGETLVVPSRDGAILVAVGTGDDPGPTELRDAAANGPPLSRG